MNFNDKKTKRVVAIIILIVIAAMVVTTIIPYMMGQLCRYVYSNFSDRVGACYGAADLQGKPEQRKEEPEQSEQSEQSEQTEKDARAAGKAQAQKKTDSYWSYFFMRSPGFRYF